MFNVIPLFKSHYSIGRSILTLNELGENKSFGADSIFDILKENKVKDLFLLEDSMSGFLQAYLNSKNAKVKLHYGLRISLCNDMEDKSTDSLKKTCKFVIFIKNTEGYHDLIKIYSHAAKEGFYYYPRLDYKVLKKLWTPNLILSVPFYDSFIFNNCLYDSLCIPEIDFTDPIFFLEDNDLPFDNLISEKVKVYAEGKFKTLKTQSIFYKNREDFKAYLTFRCINNRSTLNKPGLDHMCSDEFCFESWKEKNGSV